jgi:hypothetical protein
VIVRHWLRCSAQRRYAIVANALRRNLPPSADHEGTVLALPNLVAMGGCSGATGLFWSPRWLRESVLPTCWRNTLPLVAVRERRLRRW